MVFLQLVVLGGRSGRAVLTLTLIDLWSARRGVPGSILARPGLSGALDVLDLEGIPRCTSNPFDEDE